VDVKNISSQQQSEAKERKRNFGGLLVPKFFAGLIPCHPTNSVKALKKFLFTVKFNKDRSTMNSGVVNVGRHQIVNVKCDNS